MALNKGIWNLKPGVIDIKGTDVKSLIIGLTGPWPYKRNNA